MCMMLQETNRKKSEKEAAALKKEAEKLRKLQAKQQNGHAKFEDVEL
jgi:hypothetical protein